MNQSQGGLRNKFDEDFRFLKGWLREPGQVGSVKPTGKATARAMASFVPVESDLPVLELGPGTGVVTDALLQRGVAPEKIVAIEYSSHFCEYLTRSFPGVNFIQGDAFQVKSLLKGTPWSRFSTVIGAIPLLNVPKPKRAELIETCLELMPAGGAFVQITYGMRPPTPGVAGRYSVEATERIMKNIPPAKLFIYRKTAAAGAQSGA